MNFRDSESDIYYDDARPPGRTVVFLLCFIPMFSTVAFGAVDSWAVGALAVLAAAILIFWLVEGIRRRRLVIGWNSLQLPILGLIALAWIQLLPLGGIQTGHGELSVPGSNALTLDPYSTRFFLIRLVICLIFFGAACVYLNTSRRIQGVSIALIVFGAGMTFFAILQRLASPEGIYGVRPTPQAIPFGSFVNQHHFAAFMTMISGLSLGILLGRGLKRDRKLLVAIAVVVMAIGLIFTGSRGGLISYFSVLAFAAAVSFFTSNRKTSSSRKRKLTSADFARSRPLGIGAAACILVLVAGAAAYLGEGEALFRGIGPEMPEGGVTSGRTHYWDVAWQIFLAHPVVGAGLEAFGVAYTKYDTWSGAFRVEQAHNEYLQILADGGLLGFLCIAAFIFLLFREGFRRINSTENELHRGIAVGALAGCVGILVHSFFDFPLRTTANAFFFLLLTAIATRFIPEPRRDAGVT